MTGEREQEVMHTYWSDVNFAASTMRVSHKPDRGWTPKAIQRTRDSDSNEVGQEIEGMEDKGRQGLQFSIPDYGMQSEAGFSRLPEGVCRACEA